MLFRSNELKDDAVTVRAQEQAKENAAAEVEQRAQEMRMNAQTLASIPPAVVNQAAAGMQNNPNIHAEEN